MRTLTIGATIGKMLLALGGTTSASTQETATAAKRSPRRSDVWDGNHVSLALLDERAEVGSAWEYIGVRDKQDGATKWRSGFLIR